MRYVCRVLAICFLAVVSAGIPFRMGVAAPHRILLLSQSPDGHPAGSHEYAYGQAILTQLLQPIEGIEVTISKADGEWPEGPELLRKADTVVLFVSEGGRWIDEDPRRQQAFFELADRGGGIVGLHWALGCKSESHIPTATRLFGACHGGADRKYQVTTTNVTLTESHPITAGLKSWRIHDEFYYRLKRTDRGGELRSLVTVDVDGSPEMVGWAWSRPDGGRSFGFTGGHFHDHWLRPDYQRLFVQGILWAAKQPVPEMIAIPAKRPDAVSRVRVTLRDAADRSPLAGRVYMQSESGMWHFPRSTDPTGSALPFQREYPATGSIEMHTTVSPHPFEFDLPRGKYTLTVERGKEYLPASQSLIVDSQPIDLEVDLHRFIDMRRLGWHSADTHLHRALADMPNLAIAEDLHVVFPITYWVTSSTADPVRDNRVSSPPANAKLIQADATHFVYPMNTEYEIFETAGKRHTLGAFLGIGHQSPLRLTTPPVKTIAETIHREGGLIDLEKHSWPWSIAIVPLVRPDLYELANNHCWRTKFGFPQWTIEAAGDYMQLERNDAGLTEWGWIDFGFQTYYALLNCGFRIAPTAGSAAGVHPVPAGFGRVYVQQSGEFSLVEWLKNLKAGRSFVTTGPLMLCQVNGQPAGHVFTSTQADKLVAGSTFRIDGTIHCLAPLERVEIIVNGRIAQRITNFTVQEQQHGSGKSFVHKFHCEQAVHHSGWICIRAFEKHPDNRVRFAHSAPWYIELPDSTVTPSKPEMEYLLARCRGEWERSRELIGPAANAEYQESLRFYESIQARVK